MSSTTSGAAGARVDMPALTLDGRVRYGVSDGSNAYLTIDQTALSADLAAYRLYDILRLSIGGGVRAGGAWLQQDYTTAGEAPSLSTLAPYASPMVRTELSMTPRFSLGLEGGVSTYFISSGDDSPPFRTVPYASLDLTGFVF